MTMFKVNKGEKTNKLLKYRYKWLRKVAVFDDFEVWDSDSPNVPKNRTITEDELKKLMKEEQT